MFRQLDEPNRNIIISPLSVRIALAMLYLGTSGKAARQLEEVLSLPSQSYEETAKSYGELKRRLDNNKGVVVRLANRFYINANIPVLPSYNELMLNNFKAPTKSVLFSNEVAKEINDWVKKVTKNKIKTIIQPKTLNSSTNFIIINAIYFKGNWKDPFRPSDTEKMNFEVNPTKTVQVKMMQRTGTYNFGYLPTLLAHGLEMGYKSGKGNKNIVSMLILLPDVGSGLTQLRTKLRDQDLPALLGEMELVRVEVLIPKFKFEYAVSLKLILQNMGLTEIFSSPDFSRLTNMTKMSGVSDILHKAFIKVDEKGSKAAAVTAVADSRKVYIGPRNTFKADRPFFFAILDRKTVYFEGHVADF